MADQNSGGQVQYVLAQQADTAQSQQSSMDKNASAAQQTLKQIEEYNQLLKFGSLTPEQRKDIEFKLFLSEQAYKIQLAASDPNKVVAAQNKGQTSESKAIQNKSAQEQAWAEQYSDEARQMQLDALKGYQMGVASNAYRQNVDQAIKSQSALANSVRGANPYIAQQLAAKQGQQMMLESSSEAAKIKAQEQLDYMNALAQYRAQENSLIQTYLGAGMSLEEAKIQAQTDIKTSQISSETQKDIEASRRESDYWNRLLGLGGSVAKGVFDVTASAVGKDSTRPPSYSSSGK